LRLLGSDARALAPAQLEAGRAEDAERDREGDRERQADLETEPEHGSP